MENKIYLGDGAYATFQGYCIMLTAEDGYRATETIYLEGEHLQKLFEFAKARGLIPK